MSIGKSGEFREIFVLEGEGQNSAADRLEKLVRVRQTFSYSWLGFVVGCPQSEHVGQSKS